MNLESLNEKQIEAIKCTKNVLVVAGAGTGKTRVLTNKIASLIINKVKQEEIFAFTFTNKAASEMKSRVAKIILNLPKCNISTFHSFFFQELNMNAKTIGFDYPIAIIDQDDEMKIIRKIINENNLDIKDTDCYKYISNIKNHIKNKYKNLNESLNVSLIFKKLQQALKQINRMDFDDILYYYHQLINIDLDYLNDLIKQIKYILIDEAQDMNKIQYEIIKSLAKKSKLFFLVGDQDQCIYTFRGSNLETINNFITEYNPSIILLEENYRSNGRILECANKVIKNNLQRIDKNLYTLNKTNDYQIIYRGFHTANEEANFIANLIIKLKELNYKNEEIAILYRNNMISNIIEKELINKNIPFTIYGSYPFFMHKEIKSLINHYLFVNNPHDDLALSLILNYPKKQILDKQLEKINLSKDNTSIYEYIKNNNEFKSLYNQLEQLINNYQEMTPKEFINYLLNETQIIEKEKSSKDKIARILEFKSYIENIEDNTLIQEMINNIYLQNTKEKTNKTVSLMTIHQAKGLEFKVIIIAGCNQGIIPSNKSESKNNEEERRLFYVAITRAKERLFLTSSQRRFINGKNTYYSPSSFLFEMGGLQ